jgi:hypothetical protein
MKGGPWILTMLLALAAAPTVQAQTHSGVNLYVKETAGIKRSAYPVNARVPFAKGVLKDPAHAHLLLNDKELPSQIAVETRWPDESIQWLDVDFNATIAPLEDQTYRVEYGDDVKSAATARGLTVNQTADSIQVGSVHFSKTASPLVQSVTYRQEDIGHGLNAFSLTDNAGMAHELTSAESVKAEVVKPGPLYVVVRYTGRVALDASYSVPFTITAEMPNSKTWVKYTASVEDSGKRVRDIAFNTSLSFAAFPWLWDFGTGSWSYGSFRSATDSVILTQVVKTGANDWQIKTGAKGQEQPYEVAAGSRSKVAEGWGHFQDGKEVVAFGFDKFGRAPGTYTVAFDGGGQASFRFAPSQPGTQHQLAIYQHYVASPTPIGAVTSPVSMLGSLTAACDKDLYVKSGVPIPADAVVPKK